MSGRNCPAWEGRKEYSRSRIQAKHWMRNIGKRGRLPKSLDGAYNKGVTSRQDNRDLCLVVSTEGS